MHNLFDILFEESHSADSLDCFLNENMQIINDFYNSYYRNAAACKNSIERFILLKSNMIAQLDFSKSYAKSFALMLLDYCERFNLIAATPRVCSILTNHKIAFNHRQQAALLFLYPKPATNSELVELFTSICENIQYSIDTEEDDDRKAKATFLNYYSIIVNDTHIEYAQQVKDKLAIAVSKEEYPFLNSSPILDIEKLDLQDTDAAYAQIQCLIDRLLDKEEREIDISILEKGQNITEDDIFIENNTGYSIILESVPAKFDSIRAVSVRNAIGDAVTKRGVKILESEVELFEYMKRFGNMHKAKLETAFGALPCTFPSKINLVDWGCGQGIASMLFIEQFGNAFINRITLIEPSEIAIKRAALHVSKYIPVDKLHTLCKKLDELEPADLIKSRAEITIHLFSNILDIDDYSQTQLIQLIEKTYPGKNYFVCVSPYIDEIKTERLETFKRYFKVRYDTFNLLLDITNSKDSEDMFWQCNNTYNNPSTAHGRYPYCKKWYTNNGCNNKWTRVIKVFNIDLPQFKQ